MEAVPNSDAIDSGQMRLKLVKWAYSAVYLQCEIIKKINEKAQMANFSVFAKRSQLRNDLFATGETKKQFYLKFWKVLAYLGWYYMKGHAQSILKIW